MEREYAKDTLRLFWHEVRQHNRLFYPLIIAVPAALFLNNYASAWIIAQVINKLTASGGVNAHEIVSEFGGWIVAYIAAILLGELVLWRLVIYLLWKLETIVVYILNRRSFDTLATQSMQFHTSRFGGSLVSQVNKFSGAYVQLMDTFIFNLLPLICAFIFTFLILGPQLPLFTLGLAVLALIFMTIAWFSFRSVRSLNVVEAKTQNKLSGQLADSITNIMAVKSHAAEPVESKRYDELNLKAKRASLNVMHAIVTRDVGFGLVITLISSFAFIFLVGGQAWFGVPLGTLVLAITYSGQVLSQLWNFNSVLRGMNRAFGNAQEMTIVLNESHAVTDREDASELKVTKAAIDFCDVVYRHADAPKDDPLFDHFSLSIRPGEQIGLVGQSGSGKTTLTKLLLRFADINDGEIQIDGQNIADVTQASLRSKIAYVPQEPLLFHRSLRDNIAYGKPHATEREIEEAAEQANALDFINALPDRFGTMVGERGVKLSGGQRQRIAIARAILKDAPILILDEATSALDSQSEQLIQQAFERLMKGRTSIVIAHRLSTIAKLDRIIVLDKGAVIEDGTHDALLKKRGIYAKLWNHQSGGFIED